MNGFHDVKAYNGPDPYIFVSYSHTDREIIYPFIAELQKKYNVWFDEGIEYNSEEMWMSQIASKIKSKKCAVLLYAITKNSLTSEFCQKELCYAAKIKKRFINVLFEKMIQLPDWFDFGFGMYQICMYHQFRSAKSAICDLESKCRELEAARADKNDKTDKIDRSDKTDKTEKTAGVSEIKKPEPAPVRLPDDGNKDPGSEGDFGNGLSWRCYKNGTVIIYGEGRMADGALRMPLIPGKAAVKKAVISHGITSIGESAFSQWNTVTEISIAESVTDIGCQAFNSCYNLASVVIPDSVTVIGRYAFYNCCNLKSVSLPGKLKKIDRFLFARCKHLKNIEIPESVSEIGDSAFSNCFGLESVLIPSSVGSIEKNAFFGCRKLTIKCASGSYAEKYAKENKIGYETDGVL